MMATEEVLLCVPLCICNYRINEFYSTKLKITVFVGVSKQEFIFNDFRNKCRQTILERPCKQIGYQSGTI